MTFTYPGADAPALRAVTASVRPGQTTAIVGSTGAGKSTLVSLIARLYDVTDGAILVGGTDVRQAGLTDLWSHIGLVPQKPFLFSGTVATNLRYGDPAASDDQLWEALRVAQARRFVHTLPDSLDTQVGERGANLSGGEWRRVGRKSTGRTRAIV